MDKRTWMGPIVHEIKDQLESEFEVCDGPGAIVTCVGGGGLAIGKYRRVSSSKVRYLFKNKLFAKSTRLCKDLNLVQTHKCTLLIMGLHIFEIKLC